MMTSYRQALLPIILGVAPLLLLSALMALTRTTPVSRVRMFRISTTFRTLSAQETRRPSTRLRLAAILKLAAILSLSATRKLRVRSILLSLTPVSTSSHRLVTRRLASPLTLTPAHHRLAAAITLLLLPLRAEIISPHLLLRRVILVPLKVLVPLKALALPKTRAFLKALALLTASILPSNHALLAARTHLSTLTRATQ